ncbi:MAG: tol-pal system protein YbgF [Mariprofundaceae bacterium]|nr:tol-pal system protein YbgF [Mariprofundaceae bacterium]
MRILLSANLCEVKRRPPVLPVAVALVSCLGISACASHKEPDAWLQDKQIVIASIKQLQRDQQSLKKEMGNLQGRMMNLEQAQTVRTSMVDAQNASIRQLQTSIARLETMADRSKKSSQITKQKLVRKLDKIAKSISKAVAPPAQAVEEEKNRYTAAYLALKSGRYEEATNGFRTLLKTFPKGEYTDQAWYWLGESYYARRKLKQAVNAFETVVMHYPKSPKYAAALFKLGLAYKRASRTGDARAIFKRLIREHPDSAAAEQARRQLKDITRH